VIERVSKEIKHERTKFAPIQEFPALFDQTQMDADNLNASRERVELASDSFARHLWVQGSRSKTRTHKYSE